jgi:hypothetical protein
MLEHRTFLELGRPLEFDVPDPYRARHCWSARVLDGRALVRTISLDGLHHRLQLPLWPGTTVTVVATPRGETRVIARESAR